MKITVPTIEELRTNAGDAPTAEREDALADAVHVISESWGENCADSTYVCLAGQWLLAGLQIAENRQDERALLLAFVEWLSGEDYCDTLETLTEGVDVFLAIRKERS